jgi:uncharacterized OB-fold protein
MTVSEKVLPAPAPFVQPEIRTFWDATAEGKLLLPKCTDCGTLIWFPRPFCPECASTSVEWIQASGRGTVYSFTVNRRGVADMPAYRGAGEYVLAYVELEEGPRMMTNIVDCPQTPEALVLDMNVEVKFEKLDDKITLPLFRPAKG